MTAVGAVCFCCGSCCTGAAALALLAEPLKRQPEPPTGRLSSGSELEVVVGIGRRHLCRRHCVRLAAVAKVVICQAGVT